jgi:UDP-glucose 4-epimerase
MPVLVTGGAGFIGSNLVDELMTQGMEVRVIDDLSEGRLENLERWKNHKNFQFIRGSILDYDLVKRACDHVSCIFHLAADSRIQTGITDPRHSIETNVVGTANVAEAARQMNVSRVVYSASSSAYGRKHDADLEYVGPGKTGIDWFDEATKRVAGVGPVPPLAAGLHEDLPTDCLNPYSMSKKAGEDVMDVYHRLYGLSTVSLRYFNVYGPRHQEEGRYATVIAIFRKQLRSGKPMTIVGDGGQRRDFTFVGDVVRANVLAMMNREATGVFNIGTGRNHSINELALKLENRHFPNGMSSNQKNFEYIPPRLGEARITLADNTKAQQILGWKPNISLDQGLDVLDQYERVTGLPSGIIIATR